MKKTLSSNITNKMNTNNQNYNPSNNGKKIKNAGNNIISNNTKNIPNNKKKKPYTPFGGTRTENVILVNQSPGNGLWCVAPKNNNSQLEDKPYESIIPQLKQQAENLLDPQIEADKLLIANLKSQIISLSSQLQKEMGKSNDIDFTLAHLENSKKNLEIELDNKNYELKELKEKNIQNENDIKCINEALNNAKKEIFRLNELLNNETEKNQNLNQQLQNYLIDKERNNYQNSNEINTLTKKIETLNLEKENLIKIIQNHKQSNQENGSVEEYIKKLKEKENILKTIETTMNKALNENEILKKENSNFDIKISKLNEIINKKNEEVKNLNNQLKSQNDYIEQFNKNVKWNQKQVNSKDSNIKILKEKLKKKDEEVNLLNKKIEELNKKLKFKENYIRENFDKNINNIKIIQEKNNNKNNNNNINENNNNEEDSLEDNNNENKFKSIQQLLLPVKAKPTLFGPEREENDFDLDEQIFNS